MNPIVWSVLWLVFAGVVAHFGDRWLERRRREWVRRALTTSETK